MPNVEASCLLCEVRMPFPSTGLHVFLSLEEFFENFAPQIPEKMMKAGSE
jgi:hypothetical protein